MFSRYLVHPNSPPIPRLLISRLLYYQYALIYYFFGKFTESSRCLKDETVVVDWQATSAFFFFAYLTCCLFYFLVSVAVVVTRAS